VVNHCINQKARVTSTHLPY